MWCFEVCNKRAIKNLVAFRIVKGFECDAVRIEGRRVVAQKCSRVTERAFAAQTNDADAASTGRRGESDDSIRPLHGSITRGEAKFCATELKSYFRAEVFATTFS